MHRIEFRRRMLKTQPTLALNNGSWNKWASAKPRGPVYAVKARCSGLGLAIWEIRRQIRCDAPNLNAIGFVEIGEKPDGFFFLKYFCLLV